MGKKQQNKGKAKVEPPKQSKKKSTMPKTTPPAQPQQPEPVETASATVQRIFSGAKNKFLARIKDDSESTSGAASAGGSGSNTSSTLPKANSDPAADPPKSTTSASDPDGDGSGSGDSTTESADLSDVASNAFSQVGSGSESESDAEDPAPAQPIVPLSKSEGKGKEKEGSGQSSKTSKEATSSKPSKAGKLARFGQLVFVPIVPVVLPGNKLPMLPLPTPHEVRSLRAAGLGAVPSTSQSIFGIERDASNDKLDRYFKKLLPKPFKAMGKQAKYHLMYSHGSTLGGCGTDSPTGFDVATAYRAGKANSQKVLYIAPVKLIPDDKIKGWELDAVVAAINRRLQSKKRKRSANDSSDSEENSEESDRDSDDGTATGDEGAIDTHAMDSAEVGFEGEEPEPQVTAPPRKKVKLTTARSPSPAPNSSTSAAPSTTLASSTTAPGRVLRERNRPVASTSSVSKPVDPLNPWLNAFSYAL